MMTLLCIADSPSIYLVSIRYLLEEECEPFKRSPQINEPRLIGLSHAFFSEYFTSANGISTKKTQILFALIKASIKNDINERLNKAKVYNSKSIGYN